MQGKFQMLGIANFKCFEVFCGNFMVLMVFFSYEIVVQRSCCAKMLHTKWFFFPPHDEADGLDLQGMDLSNSQTYDLPKSILFIVNCVKLVKNQGKIV